MSDIADELIEQGFDNLTRCEAGQCEGPCQNCDEERPKKRKPRKRKERE